MKMMKSLLSVGMVGMMLCAVNAWAAPKAEAGNSGEWLTDFAAAQKLAAEKKLPILVDFSGSDWCGWCIRLDREVFSEKAFKDFAKDNLVLFLADFPRSKPQSDALKKQNEMLSNKYGIQGFPTVLLLDANGRVLHQTGYRPGGAVKYIQHLKDLLSQPPRKP